MTKKIFLFLLKMYQIFISPLLGERCRFYPSCSEYYQLAIEKYGLGQGSFLFLKRVVKCYPWHRGGIDFP